MLRLFQQASRCVWPCRLILFLLVLVACESKPQSPPPIDGAASTPATTRPSPIAASAIALRADPEQLFVLDRQRPLLWRTSIPFSSAKTHSISLPGVGVAVGLLDEVLLVTIAEPSMLLVLEATGQHKQLRRVPLPPRAKALAISPSDRLVLISSAHESKPAAGRITAISLDTWRQPWSIEVGPQPTGIAIANDHALVSHFLGSSLTRIEPLLAAPAATKLPLAQRSIDGFAANVGRNVVTAHQHNRRTVSTLMLRDERGRLIYSHKLPTRRQGEHPWRVRHVASMPTGTTLVAADGALLELGPFGKQLGKYPTATPVRRCDDPRGVVVDSRGNRAFVACSNSDVAVVSLRGAQKTRHVQLTARNDERGPELGCDSDMAAKAPKFKPHLTADAVKVERILHHYRCRYPQLTRLVRLGKTHMGRAVHALVIGRPAQLNHSKPSVYLNGGHHGNELMSINFVLDAIDTLLTSSGDPETERLLDQLVIYAVPLVNPDGNWLALREKKAGRKNGRDTNGDGERDASEGVDLNRNYPFRFNHLGEVGSSSNHRSHNYRGPSPGSEPETQMMMRLAHSEHFAASISYHVGTIAVLAPYTIDRVSSPRPNEAWSVGALVAKSVRGHPEGRIGVQRNLYPVDGTDQDWLRATHGTLALLIEGVRLRRGPPGQKRAIEAVRETWKTLFKRYLDGPSLHGRVLDATGRPLVAQVSIDEVVLREGEKWMSRCRDGRYDRYLHEDGTYTVRVQAAGRSVVRRVEVRGERLELPDIALPVVATRKARCAVASPGFPAAQPAVLRIPRTIED